ncbi:hypothetical protein LMBIIBHN_02205 [Aeromonas salmonicida]
MVSQGTQVILTLPWFKGELWRILSTAGSTAKTKALSIGSASSAATRQAVSDAVSKRSIQDVDKGESISIPTKDIGEPHFHQGQGGKREMVHPGNDQFVSGDKIDRPKGGGGGQGAGEGQASNQGEGEDDFVFQISKDEYLDLLFEDLELPRLQKTQLNQLMEMKTYRAGYTSNGVPANINVVRSLQNSLARRMALQAGKKRQLHELEERMALLATDPNEHFAEIALLEKEIGGSQLCPSSTPSISSSTTLSNGPCLPARL